MNRTRHMLRDLRRDLVKNRWIYIMAIPVIAFYILFSYIPMAGVQIAFKDYNFGAGIWGSPWAGLKHFIAFFSGPYAWRTIRNTMLLSLYTILVTFPLPIVFALLLNEVKSKLFKRTIQTVSYLPHFISLVVICGIIKEFTQSTGLVSSLLARPLPFHICRQRSLANAGLELYHLSGGAFRRGPNTVRRGRCGWCWTIPSCDPCDDPGHYAHHHYHVHFACRPVHERGIRQDTAFVQQQHL